MGDIDQLDLQHFYRTLGWLGEPLDQQPPGLAPRLRKDLIEEALFAQRRDLFSGLRWVFLDTTSIYFEGRGGESIGQRGYNKDHCPDLPQLIVAVVLDDEGRPICCELLPGNTADIKTLIPVVDRLRQRFGIQNVCIVADRGMISKATMAELTARGIRYILGARLRNVKEIRDTVLSRAGSYRVVHGPRTKSKLARIALIGKRSWPNCVSNSSKEARCSWARCSSSVGAFSLALGSEFL